MFIRPRVLSILTTRRCTAACDHCCVGSSPRATDAIPIERIHGLIDEAKRIPTIERIVFTGGECFLLGKNLDALVAHAHELGFQTRAMSNGYWATNNTAAITRLTALRSAGLDELVLSTGSFHQRFVSVDRIISAARASVALGIATRITVEMCDQSAFDQVVLERVLMPEIESTRLLITTEPWIVDAGGRGQTRITHEKLLAAGSRSHGRCLQVFNAVAVTPRQKLTACCGFPMEELPELEIGDVANQTLDAALQQAPNRLFVMWMHAQGPTAIANFAARYLPAFDVSTYASICDACIALQRHEPVMRIIAEHADEVVQPVAEAFVAMQNQE